MGKRLHTGGSQKNMWGFPTIRGALFRVPMMRIIVILGSTLGSLYSWMKESAAANKELYILLPDIRNESSRRFCQEGCALLLLDGMVNLGHHERAEAGVSSLQLDTKERG